MQTDNCTGLLCCPCLSGLESTASAFAIYSLVHPGVWFVMAITWRLEQTALIPCLARYISLVPVGCHSENTDGAALGNPVGAQSHGTDTGGKVAGPAAMELGAGYSCLGKGFRWRQKSKVRARPGMHYRRCCRSRDTLRSY